MAGEQDWAEVSFPVTAEQNPEVDLFQGRIIIRRDDTAWIDDIVFPSGLE